ncbi:TetR/AcrR family transcriptional regulator [Nocardioides sp.]|uniref:TetR/AcrR family transcriptional regulator n=1 Tax=Nocardioides sp. TaxID=35761 RepID=UPI00260F7D18|nr:TetR/AcrR family transcriptional regulator [Nocardioides sp.]
MPRIAADTVAEHHAQQRRALLSAVRELIVETGAIPSMSAVGRRAGLARTSLYQYVESADDLVRAVLAEVLPEWSGYVADAVAAAPTPAEQVWAYVRANVELMGSPEQTVTNIVMRAVDPAVLQGAVSEFHVHLQIPLRSALADFGEPEVDAMAAMIDSMIVQASRGTDPAPGAAEGPGSHVHSNEELVLGRLRRILGGYLGLA